MCSRRLSPISIPGARYAIGPAIADGFYYDFELPDGGHFSDDDLARIEARMREIVAEDQPFVRDELGREEGLAVFADQPYKQDIIERVDASEVGDGAVISVYRNPRADGAFVDLCRGPHVPTTGRLGAFKLQKVSGAYWRGDEHGPMLQRIYGTAWESKAALEEHLHRIEEAERRDHRRLGAELDLFSFPEEIGSGLAVFHPKGALVRKLMEDYSRERHEAAGYEFVYSPHITKEHLFQISGHLDWFADGMFPPMVVDEESGQETLYYLKPMNCPFHILIFKSRVRSYRELPLRMFEFGTVYRYEKSGVVHGLTRVRGMTQDDAHIFCTKEQMADELRSLLVFVLEVLRDYGLDDFYLELSTRPDGKAVGTEQEWEEATEALRQVAMGMDLDFVLDEGGGAFYGPKISVQARDAIGRTWQLSTIQVDFQLPQRFGMQYVGADNERHRPIMIHRALFGAVERFFAILLEHYAGAFPAWLAPVQVAVLPVADRHAPYALRIADRLRADGLPGGRARCALRLARRAHPPREERQGPVRARRRRRGRGCRDGRRESSRQRRARARRRRRCVRRASRRRGREPDVTLERLWAGWRVDLHRHDHDAGAARVTASSAVCCTRMPTKRGSWPTNDRVYAVLNAYPYTSGHLMVAPVRHEGELDALSADEAAALMTMTQHATTAVRTAYEPDGINVGMNLGRAAGAGVPGHLHVHVLPRWVGDTNFLTSVAEARVLPEPLSATLDRLRTAWPA